MSQEYPYAGIPLTVSVARYHIPILLRDGKPHRRIEIIRRMEDQHITQGGTPGNGIATFKKAISAFLDNGRVRQPVPGFYQLNLEISPNQTDTEVTPEIPAACSDLGDDLICAPARTIGTGAESVYVYYNENDERLARLEGRNYWDCKVGFTAGNITARILSQGPHTSMARLPKVGLVIKTDDARGLERTLHYALDDAEARIEESSGNEWFSTSPERVLAWWEAYSKSVEVLRFIKQNN